MSRDVHRYSAPSKYAPLPLGHIDPRRTSTPTCSRCGRDLVFVRMEDRPDGTPGGLMPCDAAQVYADGRRQLVVRFERGKDVLGRLVQRAPEDALGLTPHWGTCPKRERKEKPADPQISLFGSNPPSGGTSDNYA